MATDKWVELPDDGGGGGGGSPGGTDREVQFNDNGSFGGAKIDYLQTVSEAEFQSETGFDFKLSTGDSSSLNPIQQLGVTFGNGSSTSVVTFTPVSTGPNVDLIICSVVSISANPADQPVVSITYRGNNFTFILGDQQAERRFEKWYLKGVTVTGTDDITVTFTGAVDGAAILSTYYSGVDQTTPIGNTNNDQGIGTTATLNITTTAIGSYIEDLILTDLSNTGIVAGNVLPQVDLFNFNFLGLSYAGPLFTPGIFSPFWTLDLAVDWMYMAVVINPASGVLMGPYINIEQTDSFSPMGANLNFITGSGPTPGDFKFYPAGALGSGIGILDFNDLTSSRRFVFQDMSGTLALLSDVLTIGGSDKQVQFNDSGSLGGSSAFTFDKVTGTVQINSTTTSQSLNIGGNILMDNSSWFVGTGSISGDRNISLGINSVVNGDNNFICGFNTSITGDQSIAIGSESSVSNDRAIAIGNDIVASGNATVCIGGNVDGTGALSVAIGLESEATSDGCVSVGWLAKANASDAIAIGNNTTANNSKSAAIGPGATSSTDGEMQVGSVANPYTYVLHGYVTGYNEDVCVGNGIAPIVGYVPLLAQTTSITSTPIFTPPVNGTYRVSVYMVTTTVDISGIVTASITWTDDAQAQTFTTANLDLTTLGAYVQSTIFIQTKSSASISYSTNVSGTVGAPDYSIYISVERLS